MRIDDARFLHFQPQVVALACALAHPGEDRHTAVLLGDVVDQLHNNDGLAHACAAEQSDLAAAQVGLQQVDHLDARFEHLEARGLVLERRRRTVDRVMQLGIHRAHFVHRLADDVEHPPQRFRPHRHHHRLAQADSRHAAHQALGGLQRDGADAALADVLLHLADDIDGAGDRESLAGHADRGIHQRNLSFRKFAVHGRSGHLDHFADHDLVGSCHVNPWFTPRRPRRSPLR